MGTRGSVKIRYGAVCICRGYILLRGEFGDGLGKVACNVYQSKVVKGG